MDVVNEAEGGHEQVRRPGLPLLQRQAGATTLEINPDPTDASSQFDYHWRGTATAQVPRLLELMDQQSEG